MYDMLLLFGVVLLAQGKNEKTKVEASVVEMCG